jgi:hypothetical protein
VPVPPSTRLCKPAQPHVHQPSLSHTHMYIPSLYLSLSLMHTVPLQSRNSPSSATQLSVNAGPSSPSPDDVIAAMFTLFAHDVIAAMFFPPAAAAAAARKKDGVRARARARAPAANTLSHSEGQREGGSAYACAYMLV